MSLHGQVMSLPLSLSFSLALPLPPSRLLPRGGARETRVGSIRHALRDLLLFSGVKVFAVAVPEHLPRCPRRQKSGVPQERGCPFPGDGVVRTSVSFL